MFMIIASGSGVLKVAVDAFYAPTTSHKEGPGAHIREGVGGCDTPHLWTKIAKSRSKIHSKLWKKSVP